MNNVSNTTTINYAPQANAAEASTTRVSENARSRNTDIVDTARPSVMQEIKQPEQTSESQATPETLQNAVDVMNRAMLIEQRSLNFSIDEVSGRSIIKVIDQQSEQLIRQIPSEEVIRVAQDIKKLQDEMGQSLGLLINRKV